MKKNLKKNLKKMAANNHRSPVTTRALEILNIKPLTALQSLYEAGQYDKVC